MSDLVERLRDDNSDYVYTERHEAADRITELETALAEARNAALEEAAKVADDLYGRANDTLQTVKPEGLAWAAVKGNVAAARDIAQAIRDMKDRT